jgi:hypothetical protein
MSALTNHLPFETLLDYWLHDTDAATTEAIDEHLMHCEACGVALDELVALGRGVRDVFRNGRVAMILSASFLARLQQRGMRIREYRLAHNGSVNCSVAPDDELVVARIDVPLTDVRQLDAVATQSFGPGITHRLHDIPFDARAGQVLYVPKLVEIREQPRHDMTLTLLSRDQSGGEREVGRYVFHHRPWVGSGITDL